MNIFKRKAKKSEKVVEKVIDENSTEYKVQCLKNKIKNLEERCSGLRRAQTEFYNDITSNRLVNYSFSFIDRSNAEINRCEEEIREIRNQIIVLENQQEIEENSMI